jgi:hypothetical protein
VEDAFGNVETGDLGNEHPVTVALKTGSPTGTLLGTLTANDVAGVAIFSDLSLQTANSGFALTASATGLAAMDSASFTITPAAATQLAVGQQPSNTVAGQAMAPAVTVKVEDAFGNAETGDLGTEHPVTVALRTGSPAGTLLGTLTKNDVAGVATFTDLAIQMANTGFALTATATSLTSLDSASFTIMPAAATQLMVGQQPGTTIAGQAIAPALTVKVEDAFGNLVTGDLGTEHPVTVALKTGSPTGTLLGTLTKNDVAGVATFNDLAIRTANSGFALTATATSLTSVDSISFAVTPAAASQLSYTTAPQSIVAGVASGTITVQQQDTFGNAVNVTGSDLALTITSSNLSTGSFFEANGTTALVSPSIAVGTSTKSFTYKDTLASSPTLTTSASGLTSGTQIETVTPAAAATLVFTTTAQSTKINVASGTITVQQQDAFGNAVNASADVAVTLSSTSSGGTFLQTDGTTPIGGPMIPSGSSSLSFTYKDSLVGTPTITAHAAGITDGTQIETVTL